MSNRTRKRAPVRGVKPVKDRYMTAFNANTPKIKRPQRSNDAYIQQMNLGANLTPGIGPVGPS